MAIFHLSAKPVQRSQGRSSTAAAAYRAGEYITDERTGEVHDYTRKQGIEHSEIITSGNENIDREELWNGAEQAEKRKDGTPAREYEIALPDELTAEQRKELTWKFAMYLAERHGCAVDLSIHAPGKEGDHRNHHAHILCTTRRFEGGKLGAKCDVELSDKDRAKKGLPGRKAELDTTRATWERLTNQALARAGLAAIHVSHKSLEAQGIDRDPTTHLGPSATAMERRGVRTDRGDLNRERTQVNELIESLENARREIETASSAPSPPGNVSEPVRRTEPQPEAHDRPLMTPPIEADKAREYTESTIQRIIDFIKNSESYEKVRGIIDLVKRDCSQKVLWQTVSMTPEFKQANEKVRSCGELLWQATKKTEAIAVEIGGLGMMESMSYKLGKHEICRREKDAAEQKARATNEKATAERALADVRAYLTSPASDVFKAVDAHNKRAEQAERAYRVIMPMFYERRQQHENEIRVIKKQSRDISRGRS